MFSSIKEEERCLVIDRCYWPLLHWIERSQKTVCIELTVTTCEIILAIDKHWISTLKKLINQNLVELVGSGYAQIIGPLVPAAVSRKNIDLAKQAYQKVLGTLPKIWLPNELCVSQGLLELYHDCGIDTLFLEHENHRLLFDSELCNETSSKVILPDNTTLDVIWISSVAFQKLQRFIHGEIDDKSYFVWLKEIAGDSKRSALCIYGNDAEVFNFRPGRYASEKAIEHDEWQILSQVFDQIDAQYPIINPLLLSDKQRNAILPKHDIAHPIAVKKQEKYNVSRWAVTGRDDVALNTLCFRWLHSLLNSERSDDKQWQALLTLWSSDYRTHLGKERWENLRQEANLLFQQYSYSPYCINSNKTNAIPRQSRASVNVNWRQEGRLIIVESPRYYLALNCFKGLAIHEMRTRSANTSNLTFGTLEQGRFSGHKHSVDYFSGHWVYDIPFQFKLTDLVKCTPLIVQSPSDLQCIELSFRFETELGPVEKKVHFNGATGLVYVAWDVSTLSLKRGTMRYGFLSLFQAQNQKEELKLNVHNGGDELESFRLTQNSFDHGAPVPYKTTCLSGLGVTEGYMEIVQNQTRIRHGHDPMSAASIGMASCHSGPEGQIYRTWYSAREVDETAKYDHDYLEDGGGRLVCSYQIYD